jgi:hypothetical protein
MQKGSSLVGIFWIGLCSNHQFNHCSALDQQDLQGNLVLKNKPYDLSTGATQGAAKNHWSDTVQSTQGRQFS